jgi:CHAT domain-containing protein/tetratricopeptide (TPR) repeat protein
MRSRSLSPVFLAFALLLIPTLLAASEPPGSIADCDARVSRQPRDPEAYQCYEVVARRTGGWSAAAQRLEALLLLDPENHRACYALASIERELRRDRAEELYRTAIEGFAEHDDAAMEILARLGLSTMLNSRGRVEESEAETARAAELAEELADPTQLAWVRTTQARQARRRAHYDTVEELLREVETTVFPDGPVQLQSLWLQEIYMLFWQTERVEEIPEHLYRQVDLLREDGDLYALANALHNLSRFEAVNEDTRAIDTDETGGARKRLEKILSLALTSGNRGVAAFAHLDLAFLSSTTIEKRHHLRQSIEMSGHGGSYFTATRALGRSLITEEPRDPEKGFRLLDEELGRKKKTGNPHAILHSLNHRMMLEWELTREEHRAADQRDRAIRASLEALEATESLRELQNDTVVKSRTFSRWAVLFELFAGNLLWPPNETPSPEDVELAFRVMERKRARVLLEEIDLARMVISVAGKPEADNESEEIATLKEVREQLAVDEAMLFFQIGWTGRPPEKFHGGSWLFVLTRAGTRIYPLPGREKLDTTIELFLGTFPNRDGSDEAGAASLYHALLEPALADLPSEVTRLTLVPDNVLYHLPFSALRPAPGSDPIGTRYRLSLVPSATTWLRLRQNAVDLPEEPALALVDPEISSAQAMESPHRAAGTWGTLASLPHARNEGRALMRQLGRRCRILEGADASERFVKQAELSRYRVVHFATHALVDDQQPERSAIVLTPDPDGEDGLLQAGEVSELTLSGSVVVLSACRSGAGLLLEGEGVLSLARPFLVAGAQAVIGSLWQLRDDEAALLLSDFYRHLGEGKSLAEGLAAARSDRLHAGAPAAAWAGLVLLGDGSFVPFPGGRPARNPWQLPAALLLLAGLASSLAFLQRRRSNRIG